VALDDWQRDSTPSPLATIANGFRRVGTPAPAMFTTPANIVYLLLAGLGTGVAGAVLGTGGGVFLIPILVVGFGVPMHYAIGTSIISVIATSSAVASVNVERGIVNLRLAMVLEIATSLGAIFGAVAADWLSADVLEVLFAVVLVPTAVAMWRGRGHLQSSNTNGAAAHPAPSTGRLGGRYFDAALGYEVVYAVRRLWAGLAASFVAGNISGLLGIGGGVFKVPALNVWCKVPVKAAAATSNFMIGVTAAASAFLYYGRGEVRPALTAAVVLGVLAGSAIGSYVNLFIRGRLVRRIFGVLLVAVAVQMLIRVFLLGK
jgi:uncharacterized membrane protein YfcA